MKRISANTPDERSASVTAEGALLSDIYGRLVPLHATFDEGSPLSASFQSAVALELMAVLGLIEANPEFQAADAAESERRRTNSTPEELAAQERGRATVERFRRARDQHRYEEQQARERAHLTGG